MFRHHATSAVDISYAVDRVPAARVASPRHVCGTPTTVSLKVPLRTGRATSQPDQ